MSLSGVRLEAIEEGVLNSLVANQVREGRTVEYKLALPGNADADKSEFLSDVASFGNAGGGDVFFGIREELGVASEIPGLQVVDPDLETLRLENILRDGLAPRLPGVSIRPVLLSSKAVVIVIRVPRSWAAPHMVTFKNHSRFYSRNSAGKYQLDVQELRAAFAVSERLADRIKAFRIERISSIVAEQAPLPLDRGAKTILHLVPFEAFDPAAKFDVNALGREPEKLGPLYAAGWSHRYNFDGILSYSKSPDAHLANSYLQVFRSGIIEAVDAKMLRLRNGERKLIPGVAFEEKLLEGTARYLALQKGMGVNPPVVIMLSLVGVEGYQMGVDRWRVWPVEGFPIDRDIIQLPEAVLDRLEIAPSLFMRPAFDAVWNSAGWPGSVKYDAEGKRVEYGARHP